MTFEWHHWAILGVVLTVAELMVPVFVLLWFGLGALAVALLMAVVPDTELVVQLLLWIVVSSALVVVWFKVFKPQRHKILSGRSQAEAIGEVGLLVSDVEPFRKGQVRFQRPLIGADLWDCMSDETLKSGDRVKVASVEGSVVKVVAVSTALKVETPTEE